MGEKLSSPPLIEALCEFRFGPSQSLDSTASGRLYEKLQKEFPVRTEVQGYGVQIGVAGGKPQVSQLGKHSRMQFKNKDQSALVQVAPDLLTYNQLPPYPDWPVFKKQIFKVFNTHSELFDRPEIVRTGLRYINEIKLPAEPVELEDYLSFMPPWKGALQRPLSSFFQRYELVHEDPPGILIHQTGIRLKGRDSVVMLDLDFGSNKNQKFPSKQHIEEWLEGAHNRIYETFRDSLNSRYYNNLKG